MNTDFEERVLFAPHLPPAVNELLQQAVASNRENPAQAQALFLQARALDVSCLQTYFALYKFYFYRGQLHEAEQEVLLALQEAARQAGIPADYEQLATLNTDMYASDAHLFYLYSLKVLAFINLRLAQTAKARGILSVIAQLDEQDKVGASVIADLARSLEA